jgi:hypothetical protein
VDLNKLSTADKVIGGSGILFLIAMFLPWWGIDTGFGDFANTGTDYFLTGWLPLLIIIVMVGQIAITKFSTTELPKPPLPWSQIHAIGGGVVVVLLLLRTAITSSEGSGGFEVDLDRKFGLFIALIAAIGVAVGGYLKFQEGDTDETAAGSAPPTPF